MFTRRKSLQIAISAVAAPFLTRIARAQGYPNRPVRLVVGFPAGGGNDINARLIADWLSQQLGRSFIVENRAGAAGNIGLESVVRSAPDGYTLSLIGSTELRNEFLYRDLKFSFIRDTEAVCGVQQATNVLIAHPSFPVKSVSELIAAAKAKPNALTVGSAGVGTSPHFSLELFRSMTGTRMLHVPYRGGALVMNDLLAQQVDLYFALAAEAVGPVQAGRVRALAVTTATRVDAFPGIPAIAETVPGYEAIGWLGIVAPKGTPTAILEALNRTINEGLTDPKIKRTMAEMGQTPFTGSRTEFSEFLARENAKWGKIIREANITL
jgi:tripartite-type tricarboxylate transporter receptor subunit TctC